MAYLENSKSDSKLCLNRHYSTIGIEDVFVDAPPATLLPQSYLNLTNNTDNSSADAPFQTWEIVGRIKSVPEDFVVREIASRKRTPKLPFNDVVADLSSEGDSNEGNIDGTFTAKESVHRDTSINEADERKSDDRADGKLKTETGSTTDDETTDSLNFLSPAEIIEQILSNALGNEKATEILNQLGLLQQRALLCIRVGDYPNAHTDSTVWIPPLSLSHDSVCNKAQGGGNRGTLHRNLRLVFPLLKSETVLQESALQSLHANDSGDGTQSKHAWIQVSIDDSFFGLAPSLYQPEQDIPLLYTFRNQGCIVSTSQQKRNEPGRGKKRKRNETDEHDSVVLRLRPDLTREERRPVHHLISTACRDFETSTIPNYCTTNESGNIAAVVVRWSKRAQRKKERSDGFSRTVTNSLFVLKKTRKEHLAVIQRLSQALRCRQSDVGFAGIKDMHAVTYQFCTVATQVHSG